MLHHGREPTEIGGEVGDVATHVAVDALGGAEERRGEKDAAVVEKRVEVDEHRCKHVEVLPVGSFAQRMDQADRLTSSKR